MKVKTTKSSNLVTKAFFKRELKQELDQELRIFEIRIDIKLDDLRREIDDNAKKYRDEILTALDPTVKELKDAHEERTIVAHQVAEVRDSVDDHEQRITRLENKQIV